MNLENMTAGKTIIITEIGDAPHHYKDIWWIERYRYEALITRTDIEHVIIEPGVTLAFMYKSVRTRLELWLLKILCKLGL